MLLAWKALFYRTPWKRPRKKKEKIEKGPQSYSWLINVAQLDHSSSCVSRINMSLRCKSQICHRRWICLCNSVSQGWTDLLTTPSEERNTHDCDKAWAGAAGTQVTLPEALCYTDHIMLPDSEQHLQKHELWLCVLQLCINMHTYPSSCMVLCCTRWTHTHS